MALYEFAKYQLKYFLGEITEEQWDEYCLKCLKELMEQNQNVLKKLKEKA